MIYRDYQPHEDKLQQLLAIGGVVFRDQTGGTIALRTIMADDAPAAMIEYLDFTFPIDSLLRWAQQWAYANCLPLMLLAVKTAEERRMLEAAGYQSTVQTALMILTPNAQEVTHADPRASQPAEQTLQAQSPRGPVGRPYAAPPPRSPTPVESPAPPSGGGRREFFEPLHIGPPPRSTRFDSDGSDR